ncbi:MAG: site-specific integrase [Steroidobacteraceae bacterium]
MEAKITKRVVDSLKPGAKLYDVHDKDLAGFILRVAPTGRMSWFLDYRNDAGRRLKYKLGNYPGLMPDGARRLAEEQAGKVAGRVDIQSQKKASRIEGERSRVSTLGAFIEHRYEPWTLEHLRRGDVAVARLKADFDKWTNKPLSSLNPWLIESWRKDRLKSGTKPVTLNRQLDTLKAALRKAVEWDVIAIHPLQGLKRLKVDDDERVRYLSASEENRLRDALVRRENRLRNSRNRTNEWRKVRHKNPLPTRTAIFTDHLHPLVLLALNTGLRRGELFSLVWSDIDLGGSMVTVRAAASKSGDSRRIPLNIEAKCVLGSWRKQSENTEADAMVFPGAEGERLTNVQKAWATVCKLAKLTDFRFHDLRHTFASKLVQKSVDLNTVRELMGHTTMDMTLRYSHLTPSNLSAAVAKLA